MDNLSLTSSNHRLLHKLLRHGDSRNLVAGDRLRENPQNQPKGRISPKGEI
jgi:hypothetical protein